MSICHEYLDEYALCGQRGTFLIYKEDKKVFFFFAVYIYLGAITITLLHKMNECTFVSVNIGNI